jgi:transposase
MSTSIVRPFFKFRGVKILNFDVQDSGSLTMVELVPDQRFQPICSKCFNKVNRVHSTESRLIRDLNLATSKVVIKLHYRKAFCDHCGIRVEHHDFVEPYSRITKRLEQYVFALCQLMPLMDVCRLTQLNWHQVKAIDKKGLTQLFSYRTLSGLKLLCVDELAVRKGHHYLTIVANHETGEVLYVAEDRNSDSLAKFFKTLTPELLLSIEAIAMDMWDAYLKAVSDYGPHAKIVFDQFHVIKAFNAIIDEVRNSEYRQSADSSAYLKNSKYLLLKNAHNLTPVELPRLKAILRRNKNLATVYLLKDYLKRLWQYQYVKSAVKFLDYWCQLAIESAIPELKKFVKMLLRYAYGIINHCRYPISTARLEGINNKIKVMKRRAYGYHDFDYFKLKIMQATVN